MSGPTSGDSAMICSANFNDLRPVASAAPAAYQEVKFQPIPAQPLLVSTRYSRPVLPFMPTLGSGSAARVQGFVSQSDHDFAVGFTSSPSHTTRGLLRSPGVLLDSALGGGADFAALTASRVGGRQPVARKLARPQSRNEKFLMHAV